MKKYYFTLILFVFGFLVSAQTSNEVGITEGQLSVSLSGAANYTIPIAVPPGINGIVPQISLAYNSQGGNGAAGFGWNISGISTISRIPSTKFHDGAIDPVDFNALDRFAFDGQRLMVKNGTSGIYGANKTEYETESFSNVKITSYGVHPNGVNYGPAYFIVEYPDGSKAYYGSSADSCSITDWAITYWENLQGVRISYNYTLSNNVLNIASIKYGTLGNSTPINEIQFSYIARKRPEQIYVGNQSILKSNILSTIKVFSGGIGYKNYALGYDETYKDYQRLITITEKNGDNSKSYNPTTFTYGDLVANNLTSIAPSTLDLTGIDYQTMGNISGDFDGDGKTDIILYPKTTNDAKKKYWLYNNISDITLNSGIAHSIGAFEEILPTTILEGDSVNGYKLMTKKGWTVVKYDTSSNLATFSAFSFSLTTPIALQYEKSYKFPQLIYYSEHPLSCVQNRPSTKHVESISKFYLSGDFNGDSLTDIIVIERDFQYTYLAPCDINNQPLSVSDTYSGITYFVDMDKRLTTNYVFNAGNLGIDSASKIEIADVNGDGKSDIIVIKKGSVKVYSLNENNKFILLFEKKDDSIVTDKILLLGDYNGDGKADFVIPGIVGQDNWNFFMSTGTNFNKINGQIGIVYNQSDIRKYYQEITNNNDWTMSLNENSFIANDFNGDGKTDILNQQNFTVEADNSGNPNARAKGTPQMIKFQIALNMSFTESAVKFIPTVTFSYVANKTNRYPIPVFANLNDINKTFKYSLITGNSIFSLDMIWYNTFDVLLKKVTNGNGVTESISYKPLDTKSKEGQYSVYFNTSHIENYPNIDILNDPNFFVVSMLEKKSADSYKKKTFQYYSAVSNVNGLGFLGFRSTATTNWHDNDDAIISSISKNDMSLRGANTENYTVLGLHSPLISDPNAQIISSTIVKEGNYTVTGTDHLVATQSITLKPDTWIKPGSTFSAKINEEANNAPNTPIDFITKSRLTYESELLPNKVFKIKNTITKQFNSLDNTGSETYVVYDANNNPLKSTTYLKEAGATIQTTVSDVSYETPTATPYVIGRPSGKTQSVSIAGDVMTSQELYFYENNLLTRIKKKGTNTDYLTEDNSYDTFGNILKKTITATGLLPRVTSYEYDPSGRFLTKSTDIERLSTSFVYNWNGTLQSETNPYGLTTSYLYDSWFKKTTTTDYLGKKNNYVYTRSGTKTIVTSTADDGSISEETFDDLGRKIKAGSKNIMGTFAYVDYVYDILDRNYKVSEPYFGASGSQWNETKYDVYGRVKQNIAFTEKITDITYSGLTTIVNDGVKSKTSVKNAIGNVVSMTDTPGGTIKYTYFANGNLKESEYAGVKTTIKQDGWGRKTELKDSSAGIYSYDYNAFGETTSITTPNGTTTYTLDPVSGKVTQKTINGTLTNTSTTYDYDSSSKLLSGSTFTDFNNGSGKIQNTFTYDDAKRISTAVETTPYAQFTKEFKYDGFGRIDTETSIAAAGGKSSSKTIKKTYKNGAHWQLIDNTTSAILWQTNAINARGQLTNAQNGPTTVTNNYDGYGLASEFKYDKTSGSTNILTLNTVFRDPKRGNLTSRTNSLFNRNESFDYDVQDRLIEFTNAQGAQEKQLYDDQGRITKNSLGSYSYTKEQPYQNEAIALLPESLSYYTTKPRQIITYNAFKSPVLIDEKDLDKISFLYNDDNSRTAMFYGGLQDKILERPLQKYYSADGSMEIKCNKTTGVFEFITYIGGDGYTAPIVLRSNGTTQDYLYLQRDYQGTIVAITNQSGTVVEKRLFDAWGAIVSVQDGAGNVLAGLTILDRGYTGHEHLQSVGLINMNGRIYDPKLHRFLQPDNNVQDPFNTQNYNRYGYVLNNPLKYTDPSGEFWNIVAAVLSVYIYAGAATGETNPIKWNVNNLMGAFSGVASSYATGATNSYINNYNNKPALGDSAIGPGYADVHAFVSNNKLSFWDFYSNATSSTLENRNTVSSLITNSTFTGIGYGLSKFEKEVDRVGDLRNFKIQDYSSSTKSDFITKNGITAGSSNNLKYLSKSTKYLGYGASAFSLGMSFIEYSDGKIPTSVLLMDIGMTGASYSGSYGAGISAFYFIGVRNTPNYFDHRILEFNELRRVQVDNTRVRN